MPYSWVPESTLQLEDDNRCCGYAPSKGRKCRMPIAHASSRQHTALLDALSQRRPDPKQLEPFLKRLAKYGLCVRFHQYQIDDMVSKWMRRITAAYPPRAVAVIRSVPISMTASVLPSPPTTPTRSIPSPTTTNSIITSPPEQTEAAQELLRTAQARLSLLEDTQSPINDTSVLSPTSNSYNTSRRSSIATSIPPSSPTVTSSPATDFVHADSTSMTRSVQLPVMRSTTTYSTDTVTSVAVPSTPDIAPPATAESAPLQSCTRLHVHRRSLEEECSICYDSAHLSTCEPSELVWCRSGCGRSIHKSCFDAWRTQCEMDCRELTCSICREDWSPDCDCTGCTAVHARRRKATAACPICQDDMRTSEETSPGIDAQPLTWCDSGCGENVHVSCYAAWQTECLENGRDATCVTCRAVWRDGHLSPCSSSGRF